MNNLSVRGKLTLSFGFVVLIIILVIGIALFSFKRSDAATELTEQTYEVIGQVDRLRVSLGNMQAGIRGFALSGRDEFLAPYELGQTEYTDAVAKLKALVAGNAPQLARVADLEMLMLDWQEETVVPMMTIREQINSGLDIMQSMEAFVREGTGREGMNLLRDISGQIVAEEHHLLEVRRAAQEAQRLQTVYVLVGSGVLAVLIAVGMALLISGNLSRRLREAVEVAQATAQGDLTASVRSEGKDEVAALMRAIAEMQQRLREMLGQIASGSEQLAEAATELSATAQSLEESSEQQSEASSSMAAAVEELTVSINHVADGANETSTIARESDRIAGEGSDVLQRTVASIQEIARRVTVTSRDIESLVKQSDEISSIVNVIKEIAEQTNLLALNAAIEAARAGESGRGFAVVADEVRKLAERTAVSTQEIGAMITEMQNGTGRAVDAMRASIKQVDEGVELANEAGEVIVRIADGARGVVSHATSISDALKEQTVASNDVAGNVERIAQMADENNRSVRETVETVRNLEQLGYTLKNAVGRFRLR